MGPPATFPMHFATVAIVGRANVGKSTFLNAALREPLAIVSPLPQTTRESLLGIVHRPDAQLAFLDTPGLHRPRSELGKRMNATALEAARAADLLLFMTEVDPPNVRHARGESGLDAMDEELLGQLPKKTPAVAALNKVDRCRNKSRLLPLLTALTNARDFSAVVPVSLREPNDVVRLLDALAALAPEGPAGHPEDALTDRPSSFFAREFVRESVLGSLREEVPHAVAVTLEEFDEAPATVRIRATLHVEKPGQRRIVVGTGGAMIRDIGIRARLRIEALLERKVHLELFVRVTPHWRDAPRQLTELGYAHPESEWSAGHSEAPRRKTKNR